MPGGPPPQQTGPATSSVNTPMTLVGFPNRSDPIPGGGPPPPPFPAPQSASTAVKSTCHPTYSFLRNPDLHGILAQDLSFLVSQGCFMVPQRSVLDEFMRQYFRHVHPMLPLLNEADVWKSYKSQGQGCSEEEKISILVLQGILFTSCGVSSTLPSLSIEAPLLTAYSSSHLRLSAPSASEPTKSPNGPSTDAQRYGPAPPHY